MPRGSKPGEHRGGRPKGGLNKTTAQRLAPKLQMFAADVERVKREIGHIAGLDLIDLFDPDGSLRPINEWPEHARRAVSGMEVLQMGDEGNSFRLHKIKFWDKNRALEMMGRHLGMFTDKHQVTGADGRPLETRMVVEFVKPK